MKFEPSENLSYKHEICKVRLGINPRFYFMLYRIFRHMLCGVNSNIIPTVPNYTYSPPLPTIIYIYIYIYAITHDQQRPEPRDSREVGAVGSIGFNWQTDALESRSFERDWLNLQCAALESRGHELDSHRSVTAWSSISHNWSRLSFRKFPHSKKLFHHMLSRIN